jgi:hypothetical protein
MNRKGTPMPSLIRRLPFAAFFLPAPAAAPLTAAAAPAPAARAEPAPDTISRLDEMRGEAMRRLFPKLHTWWANRWEWGVALQVYAYLAEATTVEDLETRVRHIERQRHFRH